MSKRDEENYIERLNLQNRTGTWALAAFPVRHLMDKVERNRAFLEESLELVQALGCRRAEAHWMVDYVYGPEYDPRHVGEPHQECGGVMLTLAALCIANGLDMMQCGEDELASVWQRIDKIRAKVAAKPKYVSA